ncbi:hypothetical protein [Methanobrevibacter sp.]|uniref:hypothetical protein n=1 Tax=Methanobrevibacter sp. TaxID=66852 RepID=UPI00388D151B
MNMKKIFLILILSIFLMSCVFASGNNVEINGIDFKIPVQYQGGELYNGKYRLYNNFTISCIDGNVPKSIGLWAREHKFSEDVEIGDHPVRHFSQYNQAVKGNHSHAYFASGKSIYEISWAGKEINEDIENLIKDAPSSEISSADFYNCLDESFDTYKQGKIKQDEFDAQYDDLEAGYNSQLKESDIGQNKHENNMNKILLTYHNK